MSRIHRAETHHNTQHKMIGTRTAEFWLGDDGIVRDVFVLPDTKLTKADLKTNKAIIQGSGRKRPVYSDSRLVKSIDREGRRYSAGDEVSAYCSALAIHIGSPLSRMIGNFFMAINKPPYPTRLFTSESGVIDWLKTFVANEDDREFEAAVQLMGGKPALILVDMSAIAFATDLRASMAPVQQSRKRRGQLAFLFDCQSVRSSAICLSTSAVRPTRHGCSPAKLQ